jgi:hypothetical protein
MFTKYYKIILGIVALLPIAILLGNIRAEFGIVDDHEIVRAIGSDLRFEFVDFINSLKSSEAAKPFDSLRYRPVYYFLRYMEVFFWKDTAWLWYFSRVLLFLISLLFIYKIGDLLFNERLLKILFFSSVACSQYWGDIYSRLGPSESYAVPSFLMFFFLFTKKLSFNLSNLESLLLSTLGIIIVGSKENFIFIALPLLYLIFLSRGERLKCSMFVISFLFCCFIGLSVLVPAISSGSDIYSTPISLSSRIFSLLKGVWSKTLLIFISSIFIEFYYLKKNINVAGRKSKNFIVIQFVLMSMYSFQAVFYSDSMGWSRYAMPAYFFTALLSFNFLQQNFALFSRRWVSILLILNLTFFSVHGLRKNYAIMSQNVLRSIKFRQSIERVKLEYEKERSPIVFFVSNSMNFEPFYSSLEFFKFYGFDPKLMVYVSKELQSLTILDKKLIQDLNRVQNLGIQNSNVVSFDSNIDKCIVLNKPNNSVENVCQNEHSVKFEW